MSRKSNYQNVCSPHIVERFVAFDKIGYGSALILDRDDCKTIQLTINDRLFAADKRRKTMPKIHREVLIETQEISIIKRKSSFIRAYCEYCEREVSLFPPAKAAFLTCQETEEIYSLMNSNKVHFRYFKDDKPFVCLTSLCLV